MGKGERSSAETQAQNISGRQKEDRGGTAGEMGQIQKNQGKVEAIVSYFEFLSAFDRYRSEYEQFQRDVHILILGTLHASIQYLDTETKNVLGQIEEVMKKPIADEHQQQLAEEHGDVQSTNSDQEDFVRNMALVIIDPWKVACVKNAPILGSWEFPVKIPAIDFKIG